ncbi:MAG: hypothetical protein GYB67_08135, partial [Chloroflexi bacterium]|nr:hypothetical protein [Chloroflexota bacterium]
VQPLSSALAGALLDIDITAVFVGAGTLMLLVVLYAATRPAVRTLGINPDSNPDSNPEPNPEQSAEDAPALAEAAQDPA